MRSAVREGLLILSWVVLWRPIDLLIYEWIPVRRQRKLLRRLRAAEVDVRQGTGPASAAEASRPMAFTDAANTPLAGEILPNA